MPGVRVSGIASPILRMGRSHDFSSFEWMEDEDVRNPVFDVEQLAKSYQSLDAVDADLPDIVTFAEGEEWLARPRLFPRQKTILRLLFLEKLTAYDEDVVAEWTDGMRGEKDTEGINPDIGKRRETLMEKGYKHFRELIWIGGRRGSKNHLGAIIEAYLAHRLLKTNSPQMAFGIDPDKTIRCLISSTNYFRARDNQYMDIVNVIAPGGEPAPCFRGMVSGIQAGRLMLATTPEMAQWENSNRRARPPATLVFEAITSNAAAGRGVSSFSLVYDEQAWGQAGTGPRAAEELETALDPSMDEIKRAIDLYDEHGVKTGTGIVDEAFKFVPTSPYQRLGPTWEAFKDGLARDPRGAPVNEDCMVLQLSSYAPYIGWDDERACGGKNFLFEKAPQMYNDLAKRLQRRNPQRFRVERLGQWADIENAYLDDILINGMFAPFLEQDGETERRLEMQARGLLSRRYRCHIDAAKSQNGFAMMVAHLETLPTGRRDKDGNLEFWPHLVEDYHYVWLPEHYEDHHLPYFQIEDEIIEVLRKYQTLESVTFDQYGSFAVKPVMAMDLTAVGMGGVRVQEIPFTEKSNTERYEALKDAAGEGLIHVIRDDLHGDREGSILERELRYLQDIKGKVGAPEYGDVGDDLADCLAELCRQLLGRFMVDLDRGARLSGIRPAFGAPGGYNTKMEPPERAGRRPKRGVSTAREQLAKFSKETQARRQGRPGFTRGMGGNAFGGGKGFTGGR